MVLVNKLNALPDDWEDELEAVKMTNSLGDEVEVETKAYDAYLEMKDELEDEGVYVGLDSARRSVAAQQKIVDDFAEECGADYSKKPVATPGYSEHHTGLALDLFPVIGGKGVYLDEGMVQYPKSGRRSTPSMPSTASSCATWRARSTSRAAAACPGTSAISTIPQSLRRLRTRASRLRSAS